MRKLVLFLGFFSITPVFLLVASVFLLFVSFQSKTGGRSFSFLSKPEQAIAYAALPTNLDSMEGDVIQADSRVGRVENFLHLYNSPLSSYAGIIVQDADKYGIDYRLLPAIAMQESGGCQKVIHDTNNCWGYGIYGKKVTSFGSYQEGIDTITKYFAHKKLNGISSLDAIGSIYNPSNYNDWTGKVSYFMSSI